MIKPAFRQQAVTSSNITSKNVRSIHSITCDICDASYIPSPSRQDLLQASLGVLESTFMSICHYCFRCRRPACPACWDAMHGVCGACVQEAHLPFRSSACPLKGILFPPSNSPSSATSQSSMDTPIAPLLICIRPGRFQPTTSAFGPANTSATTATIATTATSAMVPTPTTPSKRHQSDPIKEPQMTSVKKNQPPVVLRSEAIDAPAQNAEDVLLRRWMKICKTIERVLNVILLSMLLFVLVLILLAELSAGANAQILQLFHVDIRTEMAYLLYVIQQIHV